MKKYAIVKKCPKCDTKMDIVDGEAKCPECGHQESV